MRSATVTTVLDAPQPEVFDYMADIEHLPRVGDRVRPRARARRGRLQGRQRARRVLLRRSTPTARPASSTCSPARRRTTMARLPHARRSRCPTAAPPTASRCSRDPACPTSCSTPSTPPCSASSEHRTRPQPLGQRVDPALELADLAGHDLRVAERVREQCGALDAGEQSDRELVRVASAHLAELALRPVDRQRRRAWPPRGRGRRRACRARSRGVPSGQPCGRPARAARPSDAGERLQSGGGAAPPLEGREQRARPRRPALDRPPGSAHPWS